MYLFVKRYELMATLILLHGVACEMNFANKKVLNFFIYFDTLGRRQEQFRIIVNKMVCMLVYF